MALLTEDEIKKVGFAYVGENVRISKTASFYGNSRMRKRHKGCLFRQETWP